MTASSDLTLVPGQTVLTRVEHAPQALFLRLVSPPALVAFLEQHSLPNDSLMRTVVEAFMRSGLPLDPATLRRARATLAGAEGSRSLAERARLFAEAQRRGLDLGPDSIDALAGHSGDERGQDSSRDRKRDRRFNSERELVEHAVERSTEEPDHPVQLFNMAPTPDGERWIVIPFAFNDDRSEYQAVVRLLLSRSAQRVIRAACSVIADSGRWSFEWAVGPTGSDTKAPSVRLYPPVGYDLDRSHPALRRLEQVLREFALQSVDVVESGESFDGFSSELPMDIMSGIQVDA